MKRFILREAPGADGLVRLTSDDFHYLARVRRLGAGDAFRALLPNGTEARALVRAVHDGELVCECIASAPRMKAAPLPPIALFQSLPKGTKLDQIVRQATENGVCEIIPFISGFSVPKLEGSAGGKLERWRRIIKEARQQSGSDIPTVVREPDTLDGVLDRWKSLKAQYKRPAGILLHQDPLDGGGSFHTCLADEPDFAAAVVGPEGGFSAAEADRFIQAGFVPLVIGANVLRVETAAVCAVAAIRITLLERKAWMLKNH